VDLIRFVFPLVLAVGTVFVTEWRMAQRALTPPHFRAPPHGPSSSVLRRTLAAMMLALVLWLAVFAPLSALGTGLEMDLEGVAPPQLFMVHAILALTLVAWYALGYLPLPEGVGGFVDQFGLRARAIGGELALGVAAGLGIWAVVIVLLIFLSALIGLLGGADALPSGPPEITLWMAGLPWLLRAAVAMSAGLFEEVFFRGFLQPRVGAGIATALFTLAHLSYGQPLMLVGVAVLSVFFAGLVAWRQSVWAAVAAHATFDLVQLLIILPLGARFLDENDPPTVVVKAAVRACAIC
jgi:membrane protease YdiL (CAAX protease family)